MRPLIRSISRLDWERIHLIRALKHLAAMLYSDQIHKLLVKVNILLIITIGLSLQDMDVEATALGPSATGILGFLTSETFDTPDIGKQKVKLAEGYFLRLFALVMDYRNKHFWQ